MSASSYPAHNWSDSLRRRASLLHLQIGALQRLVVESGGDDSMVEKACVSCQRELEIIYEREMPIARALDRSDLLLHLQGEGLIGSQPRLSLVTSIMGDVRRQVGSLMKTLISSVDEQVELPREIDLRLSSFATGSLYLGFTLPAPDSGFIELADAPLALAAKGALTTLGNVARYLDEPTGYETICRDVADPKLRDAVLSAIGQLAPSGRRGISSLGLGGRLLPNCAWSVLTPRTRQQVRSWLEQPLPVSGLQEFRGRVRAIDLDFRRFDLRRLEDVAQPDLRCIYTPALDHEARTWLDSLVVVRGRVESYRGAPRLVEVEAVSPGD